MTNKYPLLRVHRHPRKNGEPFICPNKKCNFKGDAAPKLGRHYLDRKNKKRKECNQAREQWKAWLSSYEVRKAKNFKGRTLPTIKAGTGKMGSIRATCFCTNCGSEMQKKWNYCNSCGKPSAHREKIKWQL